MDIRHHMRTRATAFMRACAHLRSGGRAAARLIFLSLPRPLGVTRCAFITDFYVTGDSLCSSECSPRPAGRRAEGEG